MGQSSQRWGDSGDQPALVKKEAGERSCLGVWSCCRLEVSSFERGLAWLGTAHTYHPPTSVSPGSWALLTQPQQP